MRARNSRYRILLVEDEALIAEALSYMLEEAGYTVTSASDGREGMESALASPPHLIISDFMMPRMHGLEMIKRLRAAASTFPVILLTAVPEENLPPGAGYDFYMTKPYEEQKLLAAIQRLMVGADRK